MTTPAVPSSDAPNQRDHTKPDAPSAPLSSPKDLGTLKSSPPAEPIFVSRNGRTAWIVISSLFGLSVVLAFLSYRQLRSTSAFLERSMQTFLAEGRTLSIPTCAEKVIEWHHRCEGLKSLCTSSLSRMTAACLRAQDRREACKKLHLGKNAGNFTYEHCKQHKGKREEKKICSLTYSGIWSYCQLTRRLDKHGQELPVLSPPSSLPSSTPVSLPSPRR